MGVEDGLIGTVSLFDLTTKESYLDMKSRRVTFMMDSRLNIAFYALYHLGIVLHRRTSLAYQLIGGGVDDGFAEA